MAGGDNCARGLALGMLLGATNGFSSIPNNWINSLKAVKELKDFLNLSNPAL
jgi:ADP-ribosylglycohydrolase